MKQRDAKRKRRREKERKRSRREKDELRRFRRRIKREENKLAQKRIGNVGRWSAGKKKKRVQSAKNHSGTRAQPRPHPSIGMILLIPGKVCDDSAFRDDLTPRNVDTRSVWHVSPYMLPKFSSNVTS